MNPVMLIPMSASVKLGSDIVFYDHIFPDSSLKSLCAHCKKYIKRVVADQK